MNKRFFRLFNLLRAENARRILRVILVDGTGWGKLVGALILLTADIWLGVQILQEKGMDTWTAIIIATGLSALQIALFVNGVQILRKSRTTWQRATAIATLLIGWIVIIADSILDGSAAFIKIGSSLPNSWGEFSAGFTDPFVFLCFVLFFIFSLLGERLARLAILGEYDETYEEQIHENHEEQQTVYPIKRLRELKSKDQTLCRMNDGGIGALDNNDPLLGQIS